MQGLGLEEPAMTDSVDESDDGQAQPSDGYTVGYKKPPKSGQFGAGNKSGKGRPKGAKNLKTMVNQALGMKTQAQIGGKSIKLSKSELAIHQLANKAIKGDLKAICKVIELEGLFGVQDNSSVPSAQEFAADMTALTAHFATKFGVLYPGEDDDHG